jgi:hypothetical protein
MILGCPLDLSPSMPFYIGTSKYIRATHVFKNLTCFNLFIFNHVDSYVFFLLHLVSMVS